MGKQTKEVREDIELLQINSEVAANSLIKEISDLQAEKEIISLETNAQIQELNEKLAAKISPIEKRIRILTLSLREYSIAQKPIHFADKKTWSLPSGDLSFRKNPDSVASSSSKKLVDSILEKNGLLTTVENARKKISKVFLTMKIELDKDAIRKDPKKSKELTGVGIIEGVERFSIKPLNSDYEIEAPIE